MPESRDSNRYGIAPSRSGVVAVSAITFSEQTNKSGMFYLKFGKRALDVVFSSVGLMLLTPLFLMIAVAVCFDSPGPIFFLQERVGKGGKPFRLVKFRSMVKNAPDLGPAITAGQDKRVTRLGKILRSWKLDELPQLWNVLKGEMSLVGPRPELPVYVQEYTTEQKQVLRVRPGITDPASVRFRNESKILGESPTPEKFYREEILPEKLSITMSYLREVSLKRDLSVIFSTLRAAADEPSPQNPRIP